MTVPDWVQDSIFYQIFPDRFYNGDRFNDPENVQAWGAKPTIRGFMGGDLRGVLQKLDYLLDLGITAIYFTPIFESPSNHRYNATDYLRIDPKLGNLSDFKALLDAAHRNGLKVVLDGVFNHCGRGFFAFNDLLENQEDSAYKNWFHVNKFPVDAYTPGDAKDYLGWWKLKSLPKFNTNHAPVRKYLLEVTRYWLEQGMDGWRLDVPNEIDDMAFWEEFRQVVKSANPDAYILGEIWDLNPRWVGETTFDGLMNYPLRTAILGFINGRLTGTQMDAEFTKLIAAYPHENLYAMYNPLGSHDTERLMTMAGNDLNRVKLGLMLQFCLPGAPAVYYGDEIGLTGGKDPDCRKAFPWESEGWNSALRAWVQQLIALRKRYPALRRGNYRALPTEDGSHTYAFARTLGSHAVILIGNAIGSHHTVHIPAGGLVPTGPAVFRDALSGEEFTVQGETLEVPVAGIGGRLLLSAP